MRGLPIKSQQSCTQPATKQHLSTWETSSPLSQIQDNLAHQHLITHHPLSAKLLGAYNGSLSSIGPQTWNNLPQEVRSEHNSEEFQRKQKTYQFSISYQSEPFHLF